MGGCEAIVLYKNKRLFLLCSYSAVNISRCLDIDKKMLWDKVSPSVKQNVWLTIVNVMKTRQLDNVKDVC